jgi:hypothetical protein
VCAVLAWLWLRADRRARETQAELDRARTAVVRVHLQLEQVVRMTAVLAAVQRQVVQVEQRVVVSGQRSGPEA